MEVLALSDETAGDRSDMVTVAMVDGVVVVETYATPSGYAKWLLAQGFSIAEALCQPYSLRSPSMQVDGHDLPDRYDYDGPDDDEVPA